MKKQVFLLIALAVLVAGGVFGQNYNEIDWGPVYNYYTGESTDEYRQLRVMVPGTFGSVDTGEFTQLVRVRYAKNRSANDRKIVEIEYAYPKTDWQKNYPNAREWKKGDKATIDELMKDQLSVGTYVITTSFEGYDASGQPIGDFVEFSTYDFDLGISRRFGVVLPGSSVSFSTSGGFIEVLSGAIGWDEAFKAASDLEAFMIYLAENVDYNKIKSEVDKTKAAFVNAPPGTCPDPLYTKDNCKGDIYKHIIYGATSSAGFWGGVLGAFPPILLLPQYYGVRKQFAIQANLVASIGYLNGYYPRGGEEFQRRLKLDNYILFTGQGPDAITFDTVLSNYAKEIIEEKLDFDLIGVIEKAPEYYENPSEIPLDYIEWVLGGLVDELKEELDDYLEDKVPKLISWIPIVGTLWDAGEGALDAIQEAKDMGSRAVKYFSTAREFRFDPKTGTITDYIGSNVNLTIPDMIDGKKVQFIEADIFKDNKTANKTTIESVTFLSEGIKTIPERAFEGFTRLKTVTFTKPINTIGASVFSGCSQLTTVNLPRNTLFTSMKFGADAFKGTNLDVASKAAIRNTGYTGAGVGEGVFVQNNTGKTITIIERRVGSTWSTVLTKSVRNGQVVAVDLASGTYDLRLRTNAVSPDGDIYTKTNVSVTDGANGTTVTPGTMITVGTRVTRVTAPTTGYIGTTVIFTADDRSTLTDDECKAFIQARCQFSDPASVWKAIETHAFASELYRTWARSYPNIPGQRYPIPRPGNRSDKDIIQSMCKFSGPEGVWDAVNKHPVPDALLKAWADSYYSRGSIIDGIADMVKDLFGIDGGKDGGGTPAPNLSLDGVWQETGRNRRVVTISGSTGTLTGINTTDPVFLDAVNKGYWAMGSIHWRNLTKTGDLTWSGEWSGITSRGSVATGTGWSSGTWTLTADGQTLDVGDVPWVRLTAQTTRPTDAQRTVWNGNGHSYEVINLTMPWTDAKRYCEERGGYLATVTSSGEQAFIEEQLRLKGNRDVYWLGGFCENDRVWKWVTRERFEFTNWYRTMPDNDLGIEDKLEMYRQSYRFGQWNDDSDNDTRNFRERGFICEWN